MNCSSHCFRRTSETARRLACRMQLIHGRRPDHVTHHCEEAMSEMTEKPMRVLVVDDNRDAAITLGMLLTACGYTVQTSFDGQDALAAAEQFQPDACVLDINMPGMDGYE